MISWLFSNLSDSLTLGSQLQQPSSIRPLQALLGPQAEASSGLPMPWFSPQTHWIQIAWRASFPVRLPACCNSTWAHLHPEILADVGHGCTHRALVSSWAQDRCCFWLDSCSVFQEGLQVLRFCTEHRNVSFLLGFGGSFSPGALYLPLTPFPEAGRLFLPQAGICAQIKAKAVSTAHG